MPKNKALKRLPATKGLAFRYLVHFQLLFFFATSELFQDAPRCRPWFVNTQSSKAPKVYFSTKVFILKLHTFQYCFVNSFERDTREGRLKTEHIVAPQDTDFNTSQSTATRKDKNQI